MTHYRTVIFTLIILFVFLFINIGYFSKLKGQKISHTYGLHLGEILEKVKTDYVEELEYNALFEESAKAIVERDEFSKFLPARSFKKFSEKLDGASAQIGLQFKFEIGFLSVVSVDPSSSIAGKIRPKDRIVQINGVEVSELSRREVSSNLDGPKDTQVILKVKRGGEEFEVTAYRKFFEKNPILFPHHLISNPDIAYMYIDFFHDLTPKYFKKAYLNLLSKNEKTKGLILDLRVNPGGALNSAVDFCDMFLKKGLIVATIGNEDGYKNRIELYEAEEGGELKIVPMVILIDRETASAAELITGCLRDHGLAKVVGEKSYGKGSAQSLYPFKSEIIGDFGIKLTVAKFYTKSGFESKPRKSVDSAGIRPDFIIDFGGQPEYYSRLDLFQESYGYWNQAVIENKTDQEIAESAVYFQDLNKNDEAILKAIEILK